MNQAVGLKFQDFEAELQKKLDLSKQTAAIVRWVSEEDLES